MKNALATMIQISFSEMKTKLDENTEIIKRQNEIILAQDSKIDSLEERLNELASRLDKAIKGESEDSLYTDWK